MSKDLVHWFRKKKKEEGIALYLALSTDDQATKNVTEYVMRLPGPRAMRRLESELRAIKADIYTPAPRPSITINKSKAAAPAPAPPQKKRMAANHTLTPVLQALSDETKMLLKERDSLRADIYNSAHWAPDGTVTKELRSNKYRFTRMQRIDAIGQAVRANHARLDAYTQTGIDPGKEQMITLPKRVIAHYLHALKSNTGFISRYKDQPDRKDEVQQKRDELQEIKEFLIEIAP